MGNITSLKFRLGRPRVGPVPLCDRGVPSKKKAGRCDWGAFWSGGCSSSQPVLASLISKPSYLQFAGLLMTGGSFLVELKGPGAGADSLPT
ncbi:uncharacterized protein VTP21DRAFT_1328 [Calcarisporiella thermophila]|uniref:uncharacterized protein n=1 Tax=Calcarisporiella thermophila TaxID=911321 RepID=UPI003742BF49